MTRLLIYLFFILSGAVALTYESLWSRYLKLFLGHSSYGQIVTLIMFMGGLGLGSFIAAKYLRKVKNPFLTYARIELVAALLGFTFHAFYEGMTGWFFGEAAAIRELSPLLADSVQIGICVLLTLPFATLLGMTFPLLASGMIRAFPDGGKRSLPLLYFANSLGGAAGILVCSYWLISTFGTIGALQLASLGNLTVAGGFYFIHRLGGFAKAATEGPQEDEPAEGKINAPAATLSSRSPQVRLWLIVAAGTGLASFIYEIGWIRLLSLILGSSTHSFDAMISAFILGLAFGGLFARRLIQRFTGDLAPVLGVIQVIMGAFAVLSLYLYQPFFNAVQTSHALFAKTEAAFPLHAVFKYLLCLALMFPSAFCAGMTLPLITWKLIRDTKKESFTGWVYGWNTIGSIIGAAIAGLFLIPVLQLKWTIFAGASLDILLGLILLSLGMFSWRAAKPKFPALAVRIGAVAVVAVALLPAFWTSFDPEVLCSGQFRQGASIKSDVLEVRHGKTATISVGDAGFNRYIATNGKSDGAIWVGDEPIPWDKTSDEATVLSLAVLPMLSQDDTYDAAVIGMGTGMTGHYLLSDERLRSLDLIEIEEAVIDLSRHFRPRNERLFQDERLNIVIEDAKRHFYTSRKKYDVIISEPSNPWVSGVSGLFTREFYGHLQHFINPGGVLVQWVHGYEFRDDLMVSIFSALQAFEHFEIYSVPGNVGDYIVVASNEPVDFISGDRLAFDSILDEELARHDQVIDYFGPRNFIASSETLKPLLAEVEALTNSDFFPYVEQQAETAFFTGNRVHLPKALTDSFVGYADIMEKDRINEARRVRAATAVPKDELTVTQIQLRDMLRGADLDSDWGHIEQLLHTATVRQAGAPEWLDQTWVKEIKAMSGSGRVEPGFLKRFELLSAIAAGEQEEAGELLPEAMELIEPEILRQPYWIRTLLAASVSLGDMKSMNAVIADGVGTCGQLSPDERLLIHEIAAKARLEWGGPSFVEREGD